MVNINIGPIEAPSRDIRPWNLDDLEFNLSRSLKVKSNGTIGLPMYDFLPMSNSTNSNLISISLSLAIYTGLYRHLNVSSLIIISNFHTHPHSPLREWYVYVCVCGGGGGGTLSKWSLIRIATVDMLTTGDVPSCRTPGSMLQWHRWGPWGNMGWVWQCAQFDCIDLTQSVTLHRLAQKLQKLTYTHCPHLSPI